ncbi:MAG: YwaF family protein [Clostridia bacterium]|nr:YwaF family protein [Clostridia bacterium]
MFDYFWKQYEDLPSGLGYMRFSAEHIVTLLVLVVLLVFAVRFLSAKDDRRAASMKVLPWIMVGLELFKDVFLISVGHFGVGYLPLHLCSLGVFVFIAASLAKTDRWRIILSEISWIVIVPGTIAALLFPDWAHLYPVFNFMNLHGYLWHGMLLLYPLMMGKSGWVHLSIKHAHYVWIFMIGAAIPVYVFDRIARCNYMFVNWPPKGTPLAWIAHITGDELYLAGYAVFAVIVIGLIYLGIELYHRSRKSNK